MKKLIIIVAFVVLMITNVVMVFQLNNAQVRNYVLEQELQIERNYSDFIFDRYKNAREDVYSMKQELKVESMAQ